MNAGIIFRNYKLWCRQNQQYFGDDVTFSSLEQVRDQLIDFHAIDCEITDLKKCTLGDICDFADWEVHDLDGKIVEVK